jgi:hypothetical protein
MSSSQQSESLFDDLHEAELDEYALEKERERQAEEARASVNKEPAAKRRSVGTASHVGLSGSTE